MRFQNQRRGSQLPEVNLVPMMDVLMTVLTFFIIISMTLTGQQVLNVVLPKTAGEGAQTEGTNQASLVVGLSADRQLLIENQPVNARQLADQMRVFLAENAGGSVILKADRGLNYKDVAQVLKMMREIGGDRVSLAIEKQ